MLAKFLRHPVLLPPAKRSPSSGGGPGGLSAAYYLQLMGHQTTVFEMLPKLGGMLRYGIPNYRLPKERLDDDINAILETGVKIEYGKRIGTDITIQELRKEYDAVLITIGASTDKKLGIEGESAEGVISAVRFLRDVGKNLNPDLSGQEVAVIGGGNVSMDAVRTAKRLGAKKVSILYRRRVADMTALPGEIEGAVAEGIEVKTLMAPARIDVDENNHVRGVYVTPQMISKIKGGRASVRATGEPDIFVPCQTLIVAIGPGYRIPALRGSRSSGQPRQDPDRALRRFRQYAWRICRRRLRVRSGIRNQSHCRCQGRCGKHRRISWFPSHDQLRCCASGA